SWVLVRIARCILICRKRANGTMFADRASTMPRRFRQRTIAMFVFNQPLTRLAPVTALCAMFGTCALARDEASAPDAGTYAAIIYVQSAGSGCLDVTGATYFGEVSFAGLSGGTQSVRIP